MAKVITTKVIVNSMFFIQVKNDKIFPETNDMVKLVSEFAIFLWLDIVKYLNEIRI